MDSPYAFGVAGAEADPDAADDANNADDSGEGDPATAVGAAHEKGAVVEATHTVDDERDADVSAAVIVNVSDGSVGVAQAVTSAVPGDTRSSSASLEAPQTRQAPTTETTATPPPNVMSTPQLTLSRSRLTSPMQTSACPTTSPSVATVAHSRTTRRRSTRALTNARDIMSLTRCDEVCGSVRVSVSTTP